MNKQILDAIRVMKDAGLNVQESWEENYTYYCVNQGDTWYSVSVSKRMSLGELRGDNPHIRRKLRPGDIIQVKVR